HSHVPSPLIDVLSLVRAIISGNGRITSHDLGLSNSFYNLDFIFSQLYVITLLTTLLFVVWISATFALQTFLIDDHILDSVRSILSVHFHICRASQFSPKSEDKIL